MILKPEEEEADGLNCIEMDSVAVSGKPRVGLDDRMLA